MKFSTSSVCDDSYNKKKLKLGKIHKFFFVFSITIFCAIGFVASDIYLPSLPAIADYYHVKASLAQNTMTVFLVTMAIFQIFSGSISDRFGRKKTLFVFVTIFILASIGCYQSNSIYELMFFRILQAVGACAGMSVGQAIVADLFDFKEMSQILSITIPLVAFSPAIAPVLGGYIEVFFNWQTNFLILAGYGLFIVLLLISPIIPKNSTQKKQSASSFNLKLLLNVLLNKKFFGFALFMMASNATYFTFVAASPFLLKKFGYSPETVGYALCAASFPYMLASLIGSRLSLYKTSLQIIFYGLSLNFIGGVFLVLMFLVQWEHMLALMIPVFIITIGNGLLMPLSSANAISLYPNNSGMVTGMLGSLQLAAAGFGTALIGFIEGATLLPLGIIVIVISVFTICYFLKVYKEKQSSDIIME